MLRMLSTRGKLRALLCALAVGAGGVLASGEADAHFRLLTPQNWMVQASDGTPQKMGPCGNEAPQTPNPVTNPVYKPGDTVTIQLMEAVFHPGHYRVALANSQAELPPEPTVTPTAQDQCASAAIQQTPTLPILADNLLSHTAPFAGNQTITVTLPANMTCTNCVLQVIEFMSSHGAPCFYHHCAIISIQSGGATSPDAGNAGTGGAAGSTSTGMGGSSSGTGGGSTTGGGSGNVTSGSTGVGGSSVTTGSSSTGAGTTTTGGSGGANGTAGPPASGGSNSVKSAAPIDNGCACRFGGHESAFRGLGALLALTLLTGRRRFRR